MLTMKKISVFVPPMFATKGQRHEEKLDHAKSKKLKTLVSSCLSGK